MVEKILMSSTKAPDLSKVSGILRAPISGTAPTFIASCNRCAHDRWRRVRRAIVERVPPR
jgi:hypothetical protein